MSQSFNVSSLICVLLIASNVLLSGCETFDQSDAKSQRAEESQPEQVNPHLLNGHQFLAEGNYDMAIVAFGMALEDDPTLAEAHRGLAKTYEALGIDELAQRNHQRAMKLDPASKQALEQVVEIEQIPSTVTIVDITEIEEVPVVTKPTPSLKAGPQAAETPTAETVFVEPVPETVTKTRPEPLPTQVTEIDEIPTASASDPVNTPEPTELRESQPWPVAVETVPAITKKQAETIAPVPSVSTVAKSIQVEPRISAEPVASNNLDGIKRLIQNGDTATALNQSIALSNREPNNLRASRLTAKLLLDSGGGNEAVPFVQRLLDANENDASAWKLMALARYQADNFPQAVFSFQQAQRLGTLDTQEQLLYARALLRVGQSDRALILLEQIHQRDPSFDSAAMLGSTLLRDRQYDRALPYLTQAHTTRPRDTTILNKLGACHISMYRRSADPVSRENALKAWRSSLESNPNQSEIRRLIKALDSGS